MTGLRAALLLLCVLCAGCGNFVRTGYNNADTALRFIADDYFDIDAAQKELLNGSLQRFHVWHRREELPRYAAFFEEAAQRVGHGMHRDDVLWAVETIRGRYRILVLRGVDEAMPVLITVNGENIDALQKKFNEKNEEYRREFLRGSVADREDAQLEAYKKRLADWIGDLSPEQEKITLDFIRAHAGAAEQKLQARKRRQAEFLTLMRNKSDAAHLRVQLREYLSDPDRNRSREELQFAHRMESDFADYMIALDRTLSSAQREKAKQRLLRYAQDARTLSAQNKAA